MDITDATLDAMITYGGSFVSGLAKLYRLADDVNQARLRGAFREYFIEYREIATLHAGRVSER